MVFDELQNMFFPIIDNRKDIHEDRLQSLVFPFVNGDIRLQEILEAPKLYIQQIGNLQNFRNFGEGNALNHFVIITQGRLLSNKQLRQVKYP
jgi:hypothetical protein